MNQLLRLPLLKHAHTQKITKIIKKQYQPPSPRKKPLSSIVEHPSK